MTTCPFCKHDPYEYVDVGVGMVPVAVTCCEPGIELFSHHRGERETVTIGWDDFIAIADRLRVPEEGEALADIAAERQRQIEEKGWSFDHDDGHFSGEMAAAAGCYALASFLDSEYSRDLLFTRYWCWDRKWWKPAGGRRDLVRAGALIVAEIERLDRAAGSASLATGQRETEAE